MEIAIAQQDESTLAEVILRARDVFSRRKKIFFAVSATCFVGIGALVFALPAQYVAISHIRIDPTRDPVASQTGEIKTGLTDEAIQTEVAAFYSLGLAKSVVDDLQLTKDPELAKTSVPLSQDDLRVVVANTLLRNLTVTREQQTYVLDVSYKNHDPVKAAQIANAFSEHYIKGAVGARTSVASAQADWYQQQLEKLSKQISEADDAAARFKAANGLTVSSAAGGNYAGTLADQEVPALAGSLADAESTAAAARAQYQAALAQAQRHGPGSVQAVLDSPVVTQLKAQRAQIVQMQTSTNANYGPLHPTARQSNASLADIDAQIASESRKIISALGSAAVSAQARADSLRGALGQIDHVRKDQAQASVEANALDREADAKRELYKQLSTEAQTSLQSAQNSMSSATIVDHAIPPQDPASPNRPLFLVLAAMLGIMAGAATIAVQEMLSGSVRSTDDIEKKLGLRLLTAVPVVNDPRPASLIVGKPTSIYAEAFRIARTGLFGSRGWPEDSPVIAFTSSLPAEGKTTSSLAFARSLADTGRRTLIIDCDVRRAALPGASGIPAREHGLTEYLRGQAEIEDILIPARDDDPLAMILVNAPYFSATNLFDTERMARLVEWARANFDQVVLDLPPIVGLADGRYLAALADVVIFVIKWNSTPLSAARSALDALQDIGKPPAGVLVNAVSENSEMLASGYYYLNRYSSYYNDAKA